MEKKYYKSNNFEIYYSRGKSHKNAQNGIKQLLFDEKERSTRPRVTNAGKNVREGQNRI